MMPLWRLALLGFLSLVVVPALHAASAPAPTLALRCSLAGFVHGRAAVDGPCRIAEADLRRAVFRLSWGAGDSGLVVAGRLEPGPLEALVSETPEASWKFIHSHPDWQRQTAPGGDARPFLQLAEIVELPSGNDVLIQLSDGGFENRYDAFLTGRRQGPDLIVTGALEPVFRVSIGVVEVLEIHPVGGQDVLLFGRTGGGDNGEIWGSVWLARLGPKEFRVTAEPYSWNSSEMGEPSHEPGHIFSRPGH